ncbi:hypothetical protein RYX36_025491 [Vicia faba]
MTQSCFQVSHYYAAIGNQEQKSLKEIELDARLRRDNPDPLVLRRTQLPDGSITSANHHTPIREKPFDGNSGLRRNEPLPLRLSQIPDRATTVNLLSTLQAVTSQPKTSPPASPKQPAPLFRPHFTIRTQLRPTTTLSPTTATTAEFPHIFCVTGVSTFFLFLCACNVSLIMLVKENWERGFYEYYCKLFCKRMEKKVS